MGKEFLSLSHLPLILQSSTRLRSLVRLLTKNPEPVGSDRSRSQWQMENARQGWRTAVSWVVSVLVSKLYVRSGSSTERLAAGPLPAPEQQKFHVQVTEALQLGQQFGPLTGGSGKNNKNVVFFRVKKKKRPRQARCSGAHL